MLIIEKDKEIEELHKSIREDGKIADGENEEQQVRERARERITEKREQIYALKNERDALENEREELGERLRERMKNIFKKYGFTVRAIVLAAGTAIGRIVNALTKRFSTAAKGVGNGLKILGKKRAQILRSLIGTIIGFIFKTTGSVIGFSERMPCFISSELRFSWLNNLKRTISNFIK